ncbi:VOC family protein [Lysinibacillus sp. JNUCC 51]|uniref:VOC family protein n=1 Tax=Lysinibacillus sp. JNUCC-51 TaxID=2792479 RepID=UPI003081CED2
MECESEEEIDSLVSQILEGGQALMPLNNYGFSKKFAWIQDRFGVSWQLTFN